MKRALWSIAVLAASLPGLNSPAAGQCNTGACGPQVVYRTVMVPQTTYKTMTVPTVVCRPEVRQATVNVPRMVAQTQMVNCRQTVLIPEQRTQQVSYNVCRMTYQDVVSNVTVMVPQTETRQGTRTVCRPVQVQETRTVCRDTGNYETNSFVDCCGCTRSYQCWVPNIVSEQVPVTVWKAQLVEEAYDYQVTVCHPETRQVTQRVAKPVMETQTRNVSFTVAVPKIVERQVPQTTYQQVVQQKVVNYTAMVPTRVDRQVTVPVCTMVPKTVACMAPACGNCGW